MTAPEASARWSGSTIWLHWLSALVIFGLLALGLIMVHATDDAARKFDLYQLHKSVGFIALALLFARLIARLAGRAPPAPPMSPMMRAAGAAMHLALYLATLIAALSGWAAASATIIPVPLRFFDTFVIPGIVIPGIVSPDATMAERMTLLHTIATWSMIALIALHVAAALKHLYVDRDDTLRRMTPRWLARR